MKKQSKTQDSDIEKEHLTPEQLELLNNERQKHLKGEGVSYTWEQVKDRIRNKSIPKRESSHEK